MTSRGGTMNDRAKLPGPRGILRYTYGEKDGWPGLQGYMNWILQFPDDKRIKVEIRDIHMASR